MAVEKKIVIAGGTGFIGKYLTKRLLDDGYRVVIISRNKNFITWSDEKALVSALEYSEFVVNLAGKSVDCRYNEKNKNEILRSRTQTTTALGNAILQCKNPPALWVNSSTATIYRHAEDRPMTEDSGEKGKGFSVDVATSWENSFFSFKLPRTRQVALRTAIVLGHGGVMKPFINLVRFGLGGRQGRGNQMFSWVHIEDLYRVMLFLEAHKQLHGIFNCSSPNPVSNKIFMKTLRQSMNIRIGLPLPRLFLDFGAAVIKTETELLLKSRWVIPEKLLRSGYAFKYPCLDEALKNILNKQRLSK